MESLLIWLGSGFAFAVGVFAGVLLMHAPTSSQAKRNAEIAEESINELRRRNVIGGQQVDYLERIAEALELRQS